MTEGVVADEVIESLAGTIMQGGVVILPTDTIYGLHCNALDEAAVAKIFQIKNRERRKPLIVLAANIGQLRSIGVHFDSGMEAFLQHVWPAALTAILPLRKPVAASAGERSLATRIPETAWLRRLIELTGPIASTSVNVSGKPAIDTMDAVDADIRDAVDSVLDGGRLEAQASTVVDFTETEPRLIREGGFRFTQELWKRWRKSL